MHHWLLCRRKKIQLTKLVPAQLTGVNTLLQEIMTNQSNIFLSYIPSFIRLFIRKYWSNQRSHDDHCRKSSKIVISPCSLMRRTFSSKSQIGNDVIHVLVASTTNFILAPTAVAQTACKRRRRCLWLALYFYT